MGHWDTVCVICGAPPSNKRMMQKELYIDNKQSTWLNNCTILLPNGNIHNNLIETNYNIIFSKPSNKEKNWYYMSRNNYFEEGSIEDNIIKNTNYIEYIKSMPKYGIFLHTDCWKYIKKKLNYEITYKNLPSHLIDIAENGFIKINYHGIEKYWGQIFDVNKEIAKDKKTFFLKSPLLNLNNRKRVDKVLSQLKLTSSDVKKRKSRPSPFLSASLVPENTYAVGNNEKSIWIKKNKKWYSIKNIKNKKLQIKLSIIKKLKVKNLLNYLYYKYELAINVDYPLFIIDISYVNNKIIYNLIGENESFNRFQSEFNI